MHAVEEVRLWLERIVIGLDLCPFAKAPMEAGRVRIIGSRADDLATLGAELMHEFSILTESNADADTSLLVIPDFLASFDDFLDAIGLAEALIEQSGNTGRLQLAHFHPDYAFDGVPEDDPANRTNRAPHPVLHILRWDQVREAMNTHPDVGRIPSRNQALLRGMDKLPPLTGPKPADFRSMIAQDKCWDRHTQAIFETQKEAVEDCILQNREEVLGLMEFIETHNIRSYLEVGVWTGRLVSTLHRVFDFDTVAAADEGYAKTKGLDIHLPDEASVFWGDSSSEAYKNWRAGLGPIDLVLIDANHNYAGVKKDFEINRQFPHRFLALHDITGANRWTTGVRKFWSEIDHGHKIEILRPHAELGLDHSIMGIGIWTAVLP
jgi:hypothetical protein